MSYELQIILIQFQVTHFIFVTNTSDHVPSNNLRFFFFIYLVYTEMPGKDLYFLLSSHFILQNVSYGKEKKPFDLIWLFFISL